MLAIPIDINLLSAQSSLHFSNVRDFALYNPSNQTFDFRPNPSCGDGAQTADLLKSWNVKEVVYSFLGDEPLERLLEEGIDVYYIGHKQMALGSVIDGLKRQIFTKIDRCNALDYLGSTTPLGYRHA